MHTVIHGMALICDPDHLCFRWTIDDNIDGPGGAVYVVILSLAAPLMYLDQISVTDPNTG